MKKVLQITKVLRLVCESSARGNRTVVTGEIGNEIDKLVTEHGDVISFIEMVSVLDRDTTVRVAMSRVCR